MERVSYDMKKIATILCVLMMAMSLTSCADGKRTNTGNEQVENQSELEKDALETVGKVSGVSGDSLTIKLSTLQELTFDTKKMKDTEKGDVEIAINDLVRVTYKKQGDELLALAYSLETQSVTSNASIDTMIQNMTLEEKVGQMFFVRTPKKDAVRDVRTYHLGGYVLFDRDVEGLDTQRFMAKIQEYQDGAKYPLLIGVDEEGGNVNRISNHKAFRGTPFWSAQDLYKQGGFNKITSDTKEKAELLKALGINVNLGPVSDVSTNPKDYIYERSFGKNADETSTYVERVVKEMKLDKMGSVLKHFPGYGNNADTHKGIVYDERSMDSFEQSDFKPFIAGIKAGADSVLVSHTIVKAMDDKQPASLSSNVHQMLRNELNFTGVIMCDDLAMDGIEDFMDDDEVALAAIQAGNDMLLSSDYEEQIPSIIDAVKKGTIKESRLDESVKRILEWKASLGLL